MNDALRAAVFARDKAICSFSGLSVWYLDHGTAPFSHADWVDHVKPKSRGGKDTLENLVCASLFYNCKKLNNGSDCQYLFSEGAPTEIFYFTHGELSSQQASLLNSHKNITAPDWYFNRAIYNVMVAIQNDLAKVDATRDREYWLTSARKRIETWKKMTSAISSFESRGLVRFPDAEDINLMLSLCSAPYEKWGKIYKQLLKCTRDNENALAKFLKAKSASARKRTVLEAEAKRFVTAPLIEVIRKNAGLL